MKKTAILLACLCTLLTLHAIPADRTPVNVAQPDGDSLTISLVGDEFYHYYTTLDGYTIMRVGARWEYAQRSGERLTPSGVLAHNAARRHSAERALTASLPRHLTDRAQAVEGRKARMSRDARNDKPNREPVVDYSLFRGLIVLINFNDKQFLMDNPNGFYNDMVNTKDFKGYYTGTGALSRFNRCMGSMRDYFRDQSMGRFDPQFDVVGPVDVPFSCRECGEQYGEVFKAALDSIDGIVDFTRYDSDQNGEVDMVFFMVAGYSASYSGNDQAYLWPHMSYLIGYDEATHRRYTFEYDGMRIGRYASSTEIYGWESYRMTDPAGIGTMCHEFSHVLGLPDLYDTDYADGGGQSIDPGEWDVMASGSHADFGRTPVGYSLWERQELGWTQPEALSEGSYTLHDLSVSNTGYILPSPVEGETFYFENRQNTKWDSALPGHGLLVARLDLTNPFVWWRNTVNADPAHNYYVLLRSNGISDENTPFPGPGGVTELNAISSPPLATWDGTVSELGLSNIAEEDGVVTFDVGSLGELNSIVEDFETMPAITEPKASGIEGRFASWSFIQSTVATGDHFGDGQECAMAMPSSLLMETDIDADLYQVTIEASNQSSTDAKLQLLYSTDKGAKWKTLTSEVVPGNETTTVKWPVKLSQPVRFRINRTAGNKNVLLYVDNLTLSFIGQQREVATVKGDVDANGVVDVDDLNAIINIMIHKAEAGDYPGNADVDGSGLVDVDDLNHVINVIVKKADR